MRRVSSAVDASFSAKFVRAENCDHGFFAELRKDTDFDLAFPDIKDGISRVSLRVDGFILAIFRHRSPGPVVVRNSFGSNRGL